VIGIPPLIGHEFTREEDMPNGPAVAILSYGFWQRQFHGDTGILGRAIDLKGEPYTVVAVMPRDFRTTQPVDVWTPLRPQRSGEGGGFNYHVTARLRPGVSWQAANDQLAAVSKVLRADPAISRNMKNLEERVVPLHAGLAHDDRRELMVTWAAVLLVLLIGCVNVAGLLLARSRARPPGRATPLAVGGRRAPVARQPPI